MHTKLPQKTEAVSEIVGALFLTSLIALVIGVIGVGLLSQGTPAYVPAVRIDLVQDGSDDLILIHRGGDTLFNETTRIYVEGDDETTNFTILGLPWTEYTAGDWLVLDKNSQPDGGYPTDVSIQIIYTAPDEPTLLYSFGRPVSPIIEPPVAQFIGTPTTGPALLIVQFTDQSSGSPTTWSWTFGDGETSTIRNPTHTYSMPGTYTVSLTVTNNGGSDTATRTNYITVTSAPITPPVADFTANVTTGPAPLTVQFTDLSTNDPTSWSWDFGDGETSTTPGPVHTYTTAGTYTVTLIVSNAAGSDTETKIDYIQVTGESFVDFVVNENVFIYGNRLSFAGNTINGTGATIILTGGLNTADTNLGASVAATTIYIDGDVIMDGGSAGLGSLPHPGNIYVNGDLTLGNGARHIYGDVYVNGDFILKDARIYGTVFVDGDLALQWTPLLAESARIYYTGTFTHPATMDPGLLAKCINQPSVPGFDMPDQQLPPPKAADWYAARGYVSGGALTSNMKVFADSYSFEPTGSMNAQNVIIVARDGDITLRRLGGSVTGVLFAPKGKVTFVGNSFEGVVIARDGFFVTSGGTTATFKNLGEYFTSPDDYPF